MGGDIPRQLGLGYARKAVEQARGKQTSKHTFSTASVSDHVSRTLPSVPVWHPLVMECDPGIVRLNKPFPPQAAFGPGVYIVTTGSKLEHSLSSISTTHMFMGVGLPTRIWATH